MTHRAKRWSKQQLATVPAGQLEAIPTGVPSAASMAREYRAWHAAGGPRVGMDPFEARDAAWECRHGRLAHDAHRDPACRCWVGPSARPVTAPAPVAVTA